MVRVGTADSQAGPHSLPRKPKTKACIQTEPENLSRYIPMFASFSFVKQLFIFVSFTLQWASGLQILLERGTSFYNIDEGQPKFMMESKPEYCIFDFLPVL